MGEREEEGVAVLSNHPLHNPQMQLLTSAPNDPDTNSRAVAAVSIVVPLPQKHKIHIDTEEAITVGRVVHVLATHLSYSKQQQCRNALDLRKIAEDFATSQAHFFAKDYGSLVLAQQAERRQAQKEGRPVDFSPFLKKAGEARAGLFELPALLPTHFSVAVGDMNIYNDFPAPVEAFTTFNLTQYLYPHMNNGAHSSSSSSSSCNEVWEEVTSSFERSESQVQARKAVDSIFRDFPQLKPRPTLYYDAGIQGNSEIFLPGESEEAVLVNPVAPDARLTFSNMPEPGLQSRPDRILIGIQPPHLTPELQLQQAAALAAKAHPASKKFGGGKDAAAAAMAAATEAANTVFLPAGSSLLSTRLGFGKHYFSQYVWEVLVERVGTYLDAVASADGKCEHDCGPHGKCQCGVCVCTNPSHLQTVHVKSEERVSTIKLSTVPWEMGKLRKGLRSRQQVREARNVTATENVFAEELGRLKSVLLPLLEFFLTVDEDLAPAEYEELHPGFPSPVPDCPANWEEVAKLLSSPLKEEFFPSDHLFLLASLETSSP
mmetsp:Transcript_25872/g.50986  ORF Transcript_25872/g.50986 Transcript_25872/m.50986 type:complete len:545 (+) Transcript_25872:3467-5101(+)